LANNTLLRFVRQVKINEGQPVNENGAKARPVSFCSIRLEGSPIVFVWYVYGRAYPPGEFEIDEFLLQAMSDTVRSIQGKTKFNVLWVGGLGSKQGPRLFQEPQAATASNKQHALSTLCEEPDGSSVRSYHRPLGDAVEQLVRQMGSHGQVVLIIPHGDESDVRLKQSTIDLVTRAKGAPKFHVVSFVKVTSLGRLAATSGGSAVLLKLENPIFGKVELEPWDVSKLKPK